MGYFESPLMGKLDILDNFGQCPKCPNQYDNGVEVFSGFPACHSTKNGASGP
jgi:hypothetical protein